MSYLLDTNHWSLIQRGDSRVVAHLHSLSADANLFMPVVAQAELLAGVEALPDGRRKADLRLLYCDVLQRAAEIVPIDSAVAERFAAIFVQLKSAGRPIPTNDIWIAAIARVHDLTLVTRDGHFRFIEGVRVEDWTEDLA